nr:tripartite tricarboxylate transporter TctB family protein [Ramlibacter albus]
MLVFALGAAVLLGVQGFPKIPGQPVGPALFPGLIAVGLCVTGLVLVVQGWRGRVTQPWLQWDDWVRSPRHVLGFAAVIVGTAFYILAANKLGFLPCAVFVLTGLFCILRMPVGRSVLVAVIAALAIHFAFYKLLRVPLPWGVLPILY